jgi:hypothetical protein
MFAAQGEIKRPAAGLSPGCRPMPGNSRGDNTASLNNPSPGMKGGARFRA